MGTLQEFDDSTTDLTTRSSYYYIPLAELSGLFANSKSIPSMVMSGLQIKLELESPVIAFKAAGGGAAVSYTISDCALFTDTFQLSDSIARKMNQLAATGGLELSYVASASTFTSGASSQDRFSISQLECFQGSSHCCRRNSDESPGCDRRQLQQRSRERAQKVAVQSWIAIFPNGTGHWNERQFDRYVVQF
jgi:hypothetical protein